MTCLTPAERASALAQRGQVSEALLILNDAAVKRDADALLELAVWHLSGQLVPRDLAMARELFRRAADAGHPDGARIFNAFLAQGTGAPAEWEAAVKMLRVRSAADQDAADQFALINAMGLLTGGTPAAIPAGRVLSQSPYVEVFERAFSARECEFLIRAADPLMQPAVIVDPQTGRQTRNNVRTSDAAGFPLVLENPAIHAINRRIAALSGIPVSHGEPLQVLRYRPGQEYRAHSDALPATKNQRVATVLVYLNGGYGGGETHFLANGLSVRGRMGDALLFRNVKADGSPDERAAHSGLPVTSGVKLIASRWIRAEPLSLEAPQR